MFSLLYIHIRHNSFENPPKYKKKHVFRAPGTDLVFLVGAVPGSWVRLGL